MKCLFDEEPPEKEQKIFARSLARSGALYSIPNQQQQQKTSFANKEARRQITITKGRACLRTDTSRAERTPIETTDSPRTRTLRREELSLKPTPGEKSKVVPFLFLGTTTTTLT